LGSFEVILLDTHVLIWTVSDAGRLSRPAAREIEKADRAGGCAIASITLWELALLFARGRLRGSGTIDASIREMVERARVQVLEITPEIADLAMAFPQDYPKDPGDRLIGATARSHGLTLITHDERILSNPLIRTVW
jgi:PIN domain nuclease of toxin-antitoxin system